MAVSKALRGRGKVVGGGRERQGGFRESCLWGCSLPGPHDAWGCLGMTTMLGKALMPGVWQSTEAG